ncbi:hypothetical protein [Oceanobacillus profundus]|nr:hypothetical protein [Oceanobacillus profundus]
MGSYHIPCGAGEKLEIIYLFFSFLILMLYLIDITLPLDDVYQLAVNQ